MARFLLLASAFTSTVVLLAACNELAGIKDGIPRSSQGGSGGTSHSSSSSQGGFGGSGGHSTSSQSDDGGTDGSTTDGGEDLDGASPDADGGCPQGHADCDDAGACATNLTTDPLHCGGCTNSCTTPNEKWSCVDSKCVSNGCAASFADCDASAPGCETQLGTVADCLSCGDVCSFQHASAKCTASGCAVDQCATGFGHCVDGGVGCETSLDTADNCGACGNACPYGICQAKACTTPTTIGPAGPGTTDQPLGGNTIILTQIYVNSASVLVALGANTVTDGVGIRLGIYREQTGAPNTLVAQTSALTTVNGTTEGLINAVSLSPGYYWVGFVAAANVRVRAETGTVPRLYATLAYGALPSTAPSLSSMNDAPLDLYAKTVKP